MGHRVAALVVVLGCASCAIGAPPGFSSGDHWSFPLVGSLEGGPLIVPVSVQDHGPYLFLVDPDSPISQVEESLARELDLLTEQGPEFVSEADESRPTFFAEVLRFRLGELTVRSRTFFMMPDGTFNSGGRRVRGLIGRDALADSTVFGFDRDRGMGHIATQQGFHPPEGAVAIGYSTAIYPDARDGVAPVRRRLVEARVNGHGYTLHVDLGESVSQLRRNLWDGAGLVPEPIRERVLVDETGAAQKVDLAATAKVELGAIAMNAVSFVPYVDKRWNYRDIDGTLGLDFFSDYTVWANWHTDTLFLVKRDGADRTAERIGRWGFPGACATTGCVTASLVLPRPDLSAAAPPAAPAVAGELDESAVMRVPAQRPTLHLARTAEVADRPFEIFLEARRPDGTVVRLPRLAVVIPAGVREVSHALDPRYIGTTLAVIDVSPYPRECVQAAGCLFAMP